MKRRTGKIMRKATVLAALAAGAALTAAEAFGIAPADLQALLARNEPVTVVDIRSPAEFAEAHVAGAMNVPAAILSRKRLPALGRVVVCGDALRAGETSAAVAALNRMAGVQAEALEGGMGAWEDLNLSSTRDAGMKAEKLRYATYRDVKQAAAGNGVVLVDLRRSGPGGTAQMRSAGRRARDAETDLGKQFPGVPEVRPARERRADGREEFSTAELPRTRDPARVFVLLDDGNGDAERMARRIRAAGLGQAVILIGGSEAVAREGQAGLRTREFPAQKGAE